MAKKRTISTGRVDTLGRPIKVAELGEREHENSADVSAMNEFDIEESVFNIYDSKEEMWLSGDTLDIAFEEVGYDFEADSHKAKIDAYRDQLTHIMEQGDAEQAYEFAAQLITGEDYSSIIGTKRAAMKRYEKNSASFRALNSALDKAVANEEEFPNAHLLYKHGSAAVDNWETASGMKMLAEDYKTLFATAIDYAEKNGAIGGEISEFDGDTIGGLHAGGDFEVGSRKWLEYRQTGMGASDIGIIADVKSPYHDKSMRKLWDSKIQPISDKQVNEQENNMVDFSNPAAQGNALEVFIGHLYATENSGVSVIRSKKTWVNNSNHTKVNFDLLTCDDGSGVPNGVLEIKSSSRPQDWGQPDDGLDGVPSNYRAQVLAQCLEGGMDKGAVAVLIDGTDYRSYNFTMDDDLREEAMKNREASEKFYSVVEASRKTGNTDFPGQYIRHHRPRADYTKSYMTKGLAGDKGRLFSAIARMRGTDTASVRDEFVASMPRDKKEWNEDTIRQGLNSLYTNSDLSGSVFTGVDLETNSLSAIRGRIIEFGAIEKHMGSGQSEEILSRVYSIPRASADTMGTGAEEVHGISLSEISGKEAFSSDKTQAEALAAMKKNRVVVAHNAGFEKQFLRAQLKGLAEAEAAGEVYFVDTMDISKRTVNDREQDRLADFADANAVEYVNAHRAAQDASLMMDAFYNWQYNYGNRKGTTA